MKKLIIVLVFGLTTVATASQPYLPEGAVICSTATQVDRLIKIAKQEDYEAGMKMLDMERCILLNRDLRVYIQELVDYTTYSITKVRPKGETFSVYCGTHQIKYR